jgi:hypothetical protein
MKSESLCFGEIACESFRLILRLKIKHIFLCCLKQREKDGKKKNYFCKLRLTVSPFWLAPTGAIELINESVSSSVSSLKVKVKLYIAKVPST